MIQLNTLTAKEWKAVCSVLETLRNETVTIVLQNDKLTIRALDSAKIAIVEVTWPRTAFSTYEVEGPLTFGMTATDLVHVVARSDSSDKVELSLDWNTDMVLFNFVNEKGSFDFHLHRVEPAPGTEQPLPRYHHDTASFEITRVFLEKALGNVSAVSAEVVEFDCRQGTMSISGKSEAGEARVTLDAATATEAGTIFGYRIINPTKAKYPARNLLDICRAVGSAADNALVGFAAGKPIRLDFRLNSQDTIIAYLLSPKNG